jgi:hypothetical protein
LSAICVMVSRAASPASCSIADGHRWKNHEAERFLHHQSEFLSGIGPMPGNFPP